MDGPRVGGINRGLRECSLVEQEGCSPVCAVVVLDCEPETVTQQALDVDVERGDLLFEVDC